MNLLIILIFSFVEISVLYSWPQDSLISKTSEELLLKNIPDSLNNSSPNSIEAFPIIMYDTDIGFGFGAKIFLFNYIELNESFDVTVFNSTKGERWYRFSASFPDFERRQGKKCPVAVDFIADYDKQIKNNFFGIGGYSTETNREYYTKEPFAFLLNFSSTPLSNFIIQAGISYKYIRNYNFEKNSKLTYQKPELNSSIVRYHSFLINLRYDSRNSFINPSKGLILQCEYESAIKSKLTNLSFNKISGWFQYYTPLIFSRLILASRFNFQTMINDSLPIQVLFTAGGNNSLRGFSQDRFIDKTLTLVNEELRFPIYWKFGAVIGIDGARVWQNPKEINLDNWKFNFVSGLRFYMENFVVRMDIGVGPETTGLFFNFGHIF